MTTDISERAFEEAIECALLRYGPDAGPGDTTTVRESLPAFGDQPTPGGYLRRLPEDYDRGLCLIPSDVVDFLLATQPKEWEKLKQYHGADVKPRFLGRLSSEIARRGALDVLRNGVKDSGCKFRLAYFRPASGLNEELQRLHAANLFTVVRQLRFSEKDEQSLDLALFLNGVPIFTAELKNALNGQEPTDRAAEKIGREVVGGRSPLLPVLSSAAGDQVPAVTETPAPKPGGGVQSDMPTPAPPRRDPAEAPPDVPEFDPRKAFLGTVQKRAAGADPAPVAAVAAPMGRCASCHAEGVPIVAGDPLMDEADLCVPCDRRIRAAWAYLFATGEPTGPLAGMVNVETLPCGGLNVDFRRPGEPDIS